MTLDDQGQGVLPIPALEEGMLGSDQPETLPNFAFENDAMDAAKIAVVGVGGGGGNAVNNMIAQGIVGADFIAVNTDAQALASNLAHVKVQAGRKLTKGLGTGARPAVGAEALQEDVDLIESTLNGYDMVFVTAGMGGGTGTGGAPVLASVARRMGILTVAIVTEPFECEGRRRSAMATEGIAKLKEYVDTLVVIPNERLLDISDEATSLMDAFRCADNVLYNATRGIADLITVHGLINLDFADVRTTMRDGGTALMGSATATGEKRAESAAMEAITSPLLDGLSIAGARNVLVNITADMSLGIREATAATSIIQQEAGEDVEVIFGTVIDETMGEELRVTVIATGFDKGRPNRTSRRTVPLREAVYNYKGEASLKVLDTPAYERRRAQSNEEPEEEKPLRSLGKGHEPSPPKVRDAPAFLRRMLD